MSKPEFLAHDKILKDAKYSVTTHGNNSKDCHVIGVFPELTLANASSSVAGSDPSSFGRTWCHQFFLSLRVSELTMCGTLFFTIQYV